MPRHPSLLAAAALAACLALAPVAAAAPRGTLVFGAEQEPPCLNLALNDCNTTWSTYVGELVIRGTYMVDPRLVYRNDLVSKVVLQLHPQRVTYVIRKDASWSDGVPVTAQDYVFTLRTIMSRAWDAKPAGGGIVSRSGFDQIDRVVVHGSKSVTFRFRTSFADWKDLFSFVLPRHALEGTDFGTDFIDGYDNPKTGAPISDGPFLLAGRHAGTDLTLVRNPRFYGRRAKLDKIVARFIPDSSSEIQALEDAEVDAIYPQPQLQLARLRHLRGVVVRSHLGPSYEHIDIQLGPRGNPLARRRWVRRALMLSVDRASLVHAVLATLNPRVRPLGNVVYMSNEPHYADHFGTWDHDPGRAARLLASHGCARGRDGIWACAGRRLSFRLESTAGNALRTLAFTVLQQQLKANGIELVGDFEPAAVFFGSDLPNGDYELAMFAWRGGADPAAATSIWSCPGDGGTQNSLGYCNPRVDLLLERGDGELDPARRAADYNAADALIASDVPTIPLYQKPTFLVFRSDVHGMTDDTTQAGPMWDAENWWIGG